MTMLRSLSPLVHLSRCASSSHSSAAIQMAYNRTGDVTENVPLVIGHGLFGQKQNWNAVSKALNKRLNTPIYLIDFRNHGESPWTDEHTYDLLADDLALFIENVVQKESGQSKVNILGHSMGGKAVSHFAVQPNKQHLLDKLIVEDIAPNRGSSSSLFIRYVEALQKLDLNKPRREILLDLEDVVPHLKTRQFLLTNLVLDSSGGSNRFKWKINLAGIGNSLQHLFEFKLEGGKFEGSSLFIYGTRSDFVNEEDKPLVKRFFPNATFKSVEAGHWLHAEAPEAFVDNVVEFLLHN
ncbi:AB hydrolase-1 domain-containing protein [Aphelenchoides bicaudatus]|nr:AB hydrolase-1 domain-containing protein [Aphelenchoides bicaudatus]